ncbi:MAG: zinc ribbon domain-containing protein [Slackia sp.]|nr:zinc ribbon domain-containing protein [Slackia sp.]
MAKFCTWCGAPLEPGARFCGECGGRILETVMVDGSRERTDDLRGFDIVDGRSLPADATLRMDRDAVVVPSDTKAKRFSLDSAKKGPNKLLVALGVVAALVVLVVAAAVFAYATGAVPLRGSDSDQGVSASESAAEAAHDEAAQSPAPAVAPVEDKPADVPRETEIFESLAAAYDKLAAYDERIGGDGGCVEEFNASFLARSMDARLKAKQTVDTLLAELQADVDGLKGMAIPSTSAYAAQAADVIELYECQIGRVQALAEAWAVDVGYEIPSEHKDEILAAYSKSSAGSTSKHLARYDELYPKAKPHEVS